MATVHKLGAFPDKNNRFNLAILSFQGDFEVNYFKSRLGIDFQEIFTLNTSHMTKREFKILVDDFQISCPTNKIYEIEVGMVIVILSGKHNGRSIVCFEYKDGYYYFSEISK